MVSTTSIHHSSPRRLVQPHPFFRGLIRPAEDTGAVNDTNDDNMGCVSQYRNGSIKACKRRATIAKYKLRSLLQRSINGGRTFVSIVDCKVCKSLHQRAQGRIVSIPHRAHDKRCVRNRNTNGLSEFTVFVNRTAATNVATNSTLPRPNSAENHAFIRKFGTVMDHFQPRPNTQQTEQVQAPQPQKPFSLYAYC